MPPFTYLYTPSTVATTIANLIAQGGQSAATAVTQAALAQSKGTTGAADAYSQALKTMAQLFGNVKMPAQQPAIPGTQGPLGLSPTDYYGGLFNPAEQPSLVSPMTTAPLSGNVGTVNWLNDPNSALFQILGY